MSCQAEVSADIASVAKWFGYRDIVVNPSSLAWNAVFATGLMVTRTLADLALDVKSKLMVMAYKYPYVIGEFPMHLATALRRDERRYDEFGLIMAHDKHIIEAMAAMIKAKLL